MSNTDIKANRPLSPHLQIYRWPITMTMSILHRMTGIGLYAGTVLLVWWLAAAASGPRAFDIANGVLGSWFGLIVLFGYTWALSTTCSAASAISSGISVSASTSRRATIWHGPTSSVRWC